MLVRIRYCGICGTDLAILSGDLSFVRDGLITYPIRIGHEWSGIVEEVGPEVSKYKPGDCVVGDNGVSIMNIEDAIGTIEFGASRVGNSLAPQWLGEFAKQLWYDK